MNHLGRLPECIQGLIVCFLDRDVLGARQPFQDAEAPLKAAVGVLQGLLWTEVQEAPQRGHGKENVPVLVGDGLAVLALESLVQLGELLVHFRPNPADVWPIKAHMRDFLTHSVRSEQCG